MYHSKSEDSWGQRKVIDQAETLKACSFHNRDCCGYTERSHQNIICSVHFWGSTITWVLTDSWCGILWVWLRAEALTVLFGGRGFEGMGIFSTRRVNVFEIGVCMRTCENPADVIPIYRQGTFPLRDSDCFLYPCPWVNMAPSLCTTCRYQECFHHMTQYLTHWVPAVVTCS